MFLGSKYHLALRARSPRESSVVMRFFSLFCCAVLRFVLPFCRFVVLRFVLFCTVLFCCVVLFCVVLFCAFCCFAVLLCCVLLCRGVSFRFFAPLSSSLSLRNPYSGARIRVIFFLRKRGETSGVLVLRSWGFRWSFDRATSFAGV